MTQANTAAHADDAGKERIQDRYPGGGRRIITEWIVIGGATIALLAWLVWAAGSASQQEIGSQLEGFEVTADDEVQLTFRVEREDPSQPATCRVIAQSQQFEKVGELDVEVPPSTEETVTIEASVKTIKPAVAVTVDDCELT